MLYFHNPSQEELLKHISHANDISESVSHYLTTIFQTRATDTLNKESSFAHEIDALGIVVLKKFFLQFPSAWGELKRKISAHKSEKANGQLYIDKSKEEVILSVFLRLGRQSWIWENLEEIFREEIFNNPALLALSSREPSILDSSHGNLHFLTQEKRTSFIEKMIRHGIWINIDKWLWDSGHQEADFEKILPQILKYLQSIFDIWFKDIPRNITIKNLAKYLSTKIWNSEGNGLDSKKAWMFVKSFSAWGWYDEIATLRESAEKRIDMIPNKFREHGIDLWPIEKEEERITDGEVLTIHKTQAKFKLSNGNILWCNLEFRVKSMRSILLKLWENEDYNNIDALKDILGFAIIFPDGTDEESKEEVILQCSQLMSNKGYILKNKGLLNTDNLSALKRHLKDKDKKPLWKVVNTRKMKTDKRLNNSSISGFSWLLWDPIGIEFQFYDQTGYDFWKNDHYTFDPLKIVSAWSRGSWFVTPHQLLHIVKKEIPESIRETVLQKLPQQIIINYLQKWQILGFCWKNEDVYFVPSQYKEEYMEKFPAMHELDPNNNEEFLKFISHMSISSPSTH